MTHQGLRARYPGPGLEPTDCPGEVDLVRDYPDSAVQVYRCRDCAHSISLSVAHGRIDNDYLHPLWPVAELAESLHVARVAESGRAGAPGAPSTDGDRAK
jgi:hypothetical protein